MSSFNDVQVFDARARAGSQVAVELVLVVPDPRSDGWPGGGAHESAETGDGADGDALAGKVLDRSEGEGMAGLMPGPALHSDPLTQQVPEFPQGISKAFTY